MTEIQTADGPVLQWEGNDLLVLVSGYRPTYRAGETIHVTVVLNNQSTRLAEARVRMRLLGRGDQAVAQAEVVATTVAPEDAVTLERELIIANTLPPDEYELSVEVPTWRLNGVQSGPGATLRTNVQVNPPA